MPISDYGLHGGGPLSLFVARYIIANIGLCRSVPATRRSPPSAAYQCG